METNPINSIRLAGRFCAKYSFILGSLIALAFFITGIKEIMIAGFIYTLTAAIINLLILSILFIYLLTYPTYYMEIGKTMALMLLNIPVALFLLWLTQEFERIPF